MFSQSEKVERFLSESFFLEQNQSLITADEIAAFLTISKKEKSISIKIRWALCSFKKNGLNRLLLHLFLFIR